MSLPRRLPPTEPDPALVALFEQPDRVPIDLGGDVSVVLGSEHVLYFPTNVSPARNLLYVLEVERPRSALTSPHCKTAVSMVSSRINPRAGGSRPGSWSCGVRFLRIPKKHAS